MHKQMFKINTAPMWVINSQAQFSLLYIPVLSVVA